MGHLLRLKKLEVLPYLELNKCEIKRVMKTKSLEIVADDGLLWTDQFKSLPGNLAVGYHKKAKENSPSFKII